MSHLFDSIIALFLSPHFSVTKHVYFTMGSGSSSVCNDDRKIRIHAWFPQIKIRYSII